MKYIKVEYDGEEIYINTITENDLLYRIDMSDCIDYEYDIFYFDITERQFKKAIIKGIWHYGNNPLYIEVLDQNNNILTSGYGTDH